MSKTVSVRISKECHKVLKFISALSDKNLYTVYSEAVEHFKKNHHDQLVNDSIIPPTTHPLRYPREAVPVTVPSELHSFTHDLANRTFRNSVQSADSIIILYQNSLEMNFEGRLDWLDPIELQWMETIPGAR